MIRWTHFGDRLQDLYYGDQQVDHRLRVDRHPAILSMGMQSAFMPAHVYREKSWLGLPRREIRLANGGLVVPAILEPNAIKSILVYLGLPDKPPELAAARLPEQAQFA